jgi:hypothetical protein
MKGITIFCAACQAACAGIFVQGRQWGWLTFSLLMIGIMMATFVCDAIKERK